MSFSEIAARSAIDHTKNLSDSFISIISFLRAEPDYASKLAGKNSPSIGSDEYIQKLAAKFIKSREPKEPAPPETIPDKMVSYILENYFKVPTSNLEEIKRTHQLSMGAENIVGDLLERYLDSVLAPSGWVWCSGSIVKSVDFIKFEDGKWKTLQVKNRDNSENSSSSKVRDGTDISKWHRTFSKKPGDNWAAFPDENERAKLNEVAFEAFVMSYLIKLPSFQKA